MDKRIEDYLDIIRDELSKLRDNKFYGSINHNFVIRNGGITRLKSTLDREIIRPEDIKKGGKS